MGANRNILLSIFIVLTGILCLGTSVQGDTSQESIDTQTDLSILNENLPTIETTVVGFRLEGPGWKDRVEIGALDILWMSDEQRFLPLLHLCKKFEIICTEEQSVIRFQSPKGDSIFVNLSSQQMAVGTESFPISIRIGRSDVTGWGEVFLPDSLVAYALAIDLEWNANEFQYKGKARHAVPKVARLRTEKAENRKRKRAEEDEFTTQGVSLPEFLPPATPNRFNDPSIGTIRPGINVSGTTAGNLTVQRSLDLWGRLLGGEYSTRFRQSELEWDSYTRLDRAYWYRKFTTVEVNVGDVVMGLNELVFPATSLAGLEINGLVGAGTDKQAGAKAQNGRYNRFGSRFDFRGYALLGSTVHLYRGDRHIAEQQVTETDGAPVGQGLYSFRGVNLLRGMRNEIRIVVVEPDSTIHEITREIVGTDKLLRFGQVAFIGGVGTRRLYDEEFWFTQGQFAGGRLSIGLLPSMTLGPLFAWQRDYAYNFPLRALEDNRQSERVNVPGESSHAGVEWGWRLFDRMIISAMGAGSRSEADSLTRYAGRASIQFPLGPLLLEPQAFIYQPNYFNGSNNLVEDREGYAASLLCPLTRSSRIVLATGQVEDDIEKTEGTKTVLQWQRFDFTAPRVMRDMELLVTGERLTPRYEASHYLWTVNGKLGLPLDFKVFGMTTWGDEFSEVEGRNLIEDLGITDAPRSRRVGWEANLYRPLLKAGSLTLTHSEMSFRKRTYLTHTLQARGRSHIQWRLQGGYDWEPQTPFGQGQINYNLDRSGTGTIGVLARLQRNEWVFGVTLSLQPTFGFVGGKPILVSQSRLSPKVGGLKGQVFLDSNGNGLRESGEPGIGGVEILTNTGQRITPSRSGKFILTPRGEHSRVRVQLNPATVPAFYAATNGAQWAELEEGALTRVNLGLVILNSISGKLVGPDSHDSTRTIGIGMVRIMARTAEGNIAKESITSGSGSYYLGELKPGDYRIEVDERTLPAGYYSVEGQAAISLHPEGEPIDLESINLQLGYIPPPVKEEKKEEAPIQKKEVEYQRF